MRFLGHDAYLSPTNPNFVPYFPEDPTSGGEWVYTSPGGEPAQSVVDLLAIGVSEKAERVLTACRIEGVYSLSKTDGSTPRARRDER